MQNWGIKSLNEDAIPVNNAGDGSKIAGLDNNPPAKKKKKLRQIISR